MKHLTVSKVRVAFEIDIVTTDGRTHSAKSGEHYHGGPRNSLAWDDLSDKFRDCSDLLLNTNQQDAMLHMLDNIESLRDIRDLVALAQPL